MEVFTAIMGALGGFSAVLVGLIAYLGNLRLEKYKSDLEVTNTKLKSLTETSSHISKTQFDKEFAIYQEIWILLVGLRAKTLSLRPMMDYIDPTESEEERTKRRLQAFAEAFYGFRDAIENNRPFYSHSVYETLKEVFDLCYEESVDFEHRDPGYSREYWEKARENSKKIVTSIDACCEKIRDRIGSLAVVE